MSIRNRRRRCGSRSARAAIPQAGVGMAQLKSQEKGNAVMDIIKKVVHEMGNDQAFYVADLSDIVYKCRYWKSKLPTVEPFYAVKCNSDPMVLRLMTALGVRFDCASKNEIETALMAGAQTSDIIFAHPYKSNSFLKYAAALNVDLMTFDSEQELVKISSIFPQARLLLRIRTPDVRAGFPLSNKFGCKVSEAKQILVLARKMKMNVVGVSFHVGSLCEEPSAFQQAIQLARQVFDTADDLGFRFDLLDIGGGFPGASGTQDVFDQMCYYINLGLREHFPAGVRVIAEPGCYLVCSAYTLCTKIVGKRFFKESEDDEHDVHERKCFYYMNDGAYGSFAFGFEKYGFRLHPLVREGCDVRRRTLRRSKVWGSTCCSSDCILEECLLPEMEVGEHLVFENMGAYTLTLTTTFNGFPKPCTRYVFTALSRNETRPLPPYEEFCRQLGPKKLKAFVKIQEFICHDDSNVDQFRKG